MGDGTLRYQEEAASLLLSRALSSLCLGRLEALCLANLHTSLHSLGNRSWNWTKGWQRRVVSQLAETKVRTCKKLLQEGKVISSTISGTRLFSSLSLGTRLFSSLSLVRR